MKIAFFTDSYEPQINGLVTSIDMFAKELKKNGHEVIIFAPYSPNYKDKEKNVRRIKSVEFSNYKEYRIGIPFRLMINPKIKDVDIIHIHSPFSVGLTGLLFSKQYGIPCVSTFHTLYSEYLHYLIKNSMISNSKKFKKLFSKVSWSYMRWFYNSSDVVIAPSKQIKNVIRKNGIKKHTEVIPTGTKFESIKKSKKKLRKKYGFVNEKIILHVGRVSKEKNMEFIINSLKKELSENNWKLIIASDGPHRSKLENLAKSLNLKNKIIFTGYLSDDALQEYYNLSDVFVMASKAETQGIVLLEAAKYGIPSVVLNSPVIADFVRQNKTGIVSSKSNFSSDIEKLLLSNSLRKKIIENC